MQWIEGMPQEPMIWILGKGRDRNGRLVVPPIPWLSSKRDDGDVRIRIGQDGELHRTGDSRHNTGLVENWGLTGTEWSSLGLQTYGSLFTFLHKYIIVKVVHGGRIYNLEITSLRGKIVSHIGKVGWGSYPVLVKFQGEEYSDFPSWIDTER